MRRSAFSFALMLFTSPLLSFSQATAGNQTATTTVAVSPGTVSIGVPVALSATVQPTPSGQAVITHRPSGAVTFFDGTTALKPGAVTLTPSSGFSGASFQQTFGTPDASFAGRLPGVLGSSASGDILLYTALPSGALPNITVLTVQNFTIDANGIYTAHTSQGLNFPVPVNPLSVVIAVHPQLLDVNGDGKLDLLYGVAAAYGNGDGTFQTPTALPFLASGFSTTYAADLNGDGKADILAVNTPSAAAVSSAMVQFQATVFRNDGSSSFTPVATFPIAEPFSLPANFVYAYNLFSIDLFDANSDGKLDMLVQSNEVPIVNGGQSAVKLSVLLNNGDGSFGALKPVALQTYSLAPYAVGFGDFTGDSKMDIALSYFEPDFQHQTIDLLPGNNDGTFSPAITTILEPGVPAIPGSGNGAPIVVGDFNLDGKLDVALGSGAFETGNGDGTFTSGVPFFPVAASANGSLTIYPLSLSTLPGQAVPSLVFANLQGKAPAVFTPQTFATASVTYMPSTAGTHSLTAQYSGDSGYAASISPSVNVTVTPSATGTTLVSSANPSYAGQQVVYTTTVSGGSAPTGNVVFTSGTSTLATMPLSGGTATYMMAFNTAGTQVVTATYSGDASNQGSSGSLRQTVNAAFNPGPGNGSTSTIAVKSGESASTPISITGASGFAGMVALACSDLPANASCSFSPAMVSVSGGTAGSTTLTVSTSATVTARSLSLSPFGTEMTLACGLGLSSALLLWPTRRRHARLWIVIGCTLAIAGVTAIGCGGSSSSAKSSAATSTPAGTYTFHVNATSGSVHTVSAYTLTVQ